MKRNGKSKQKVAGALSNTKLMEVGLTAHIKYIRLLKLHPE